VYDKRERRNRRSLSVLTELDVVEAGEAIIKSPRRNLGHLAKRIGVSPSTAWKICPYDLFFPYKMEQSQPLPENRIVRRLFCEGERSATEKNPGVFNVLQFFHEAYFQMDGSANKLPHKLYEIF
jgi:hypothetical protein